MKRTFSTMRMQVTLSLALLVLSQQWGWAAATPDVTILGTISQNLRAPGKLSLDSAGKIYVADAKNRGIVTYDANGRFKGRIKVSGIVRGVACTADGRILVSHDKVVTIYNAAGVEVRNLTGFDFSLPNGITTDAAGSIYVVDSKANKIAIFDQAGRFTGAFGVAGTRAGQFQFPTGIAYEKVSNQLAIADTLNNRIQFFDTAGLFKRVIGTPSILSGPLCFTYPQGIAFDYTAGVRMYVVDTYQSSVQAINLTASPVFETYIGSYGFADGQFTIPSDVAFDPQNRRLLVVDNSGLITAFGINGGKNPIDPQAHGLTLDPVPLTVTAAALSLRGSADPGSRVSITIGAAPLVEGSVQGTSWSAAVSLLEGDNIITVAATDTAGKTTTVAVAVTYVIASNATNSDGYAGTAQSDTTASGSQTGGTNTGYGHGLPTTRTWNPPTGTDCRHARSGGVVCR